ncbi:phosphoglycerate mutase [Actinoplanes italicus]|uniref:Broad specificity phosphatase PhoE n=1 Tax=Actinoplanes italicus TaxID=113567 RepID=A0A2T0KH65_9ACTN|nr:histidine phosphatase family protein [Actinoplanes italicus]PRX22770.1 broad specificity phosphatase PhoE [Actinoplanes italicus]GIE28293.1 phosphoglycerate mutase [Actinoplanes italicus]
MTRLRLIAAGHTPALRHGVFGGDDDLDEGARNATAHLRDSPLLQPRLYPGTPWTVAPTRAARQTAAILTTATAHEDSQLRDPGYGTWTGLTLDQVDLTAWLTDPGARPHHGETHTEITARAAQWLHTQTSRSQTVVAHPAVIRALLATALDLPAGHHHQLAVSPLAVAHLTHHHRWVLHLPTA